MTLGIGWSVLGGLGQGTFAEALIFIDQYRSMQERGLIDLKGEAEGVQPNSWRGCTETHQAA